MNSPVVKLRAPELEDVEWMLVCENEADLSQIATGPYSRFQMERFVRESTNNLFADQSLRFIVESEAGELVGIVDVFNFDSRHSRGEIGIYIHPSHRRQGYGAAALKALEAHCFRLLDIHQLYAYVMEDNLPSKHLFEKCGYVPCGVLHDWVKVGKRYVAVSLFQKIN